MSMEGNEATQRLVSFAVIMGVVGALLTFAPLALGFLIVMVCTDEHLLTFR
jgi:hypothetical protein